MNDHNRYEEVFLRVKIRIFEVNSIIETNTNGFELSYNKDMINVVTQKI